MASVPSLPAHCGSWIIVCRETGDAVLETWSYDVASRVNGQKYEVRTALAHLASLNRKE